MVYQPPGGEGFIALGCGSKRWIEDRLQQVFHRWGYHRITSTLERLDTLMAGGAIQQSTVIQLQNAEEELGLRPELTASIARTAVTRMAGVTYPNLYYNVFRRTRESSHNRQQEFYQAGVECWVRRAGWLMMLGAAGRLSESTEFKPRKFDFRRGRNHAITPVALSTCNPRQGA